MMILQRLKKFIDYKGITIAAFERSIGMSNASFGKTLKNNGALGSDKLENIILTYPELSTIWLMTGIGDMINTDIGSVKNPGIKIVSGANNRNINTNINSSHIKNSTQQTDGKVEIENNTLKVKIEYLEKILSEKDKIIAEKERYIVLLEQQTNKK